MLNIMLSSVPHMISINTKSPEEQLASKQGVIHKPHEVKQPAYVRTVNQHQPNMLVQEAILMNRRT
jgi:hypothetical protein